MDDRDEHSERVGRLRGVIRELRELVSAGPDAFSASEDRAGSAKYHLLVAAQACADIARRLISSQGWRVPKDGADAYRVLVEEGVLPRDCLRPCQQMGRFGRRLLRPYRGLEDELVYRYLQESLPDLESYAKAVSEFVGAQPDE